MSAKIRRSKILGLNLIKIKEYENYETYHLFGLQFFKKNKTQQRKIYDLLNEIKDQLNNHNEKLKFLEGKSLWLDNNILRLEEKIDYQQERNYQIESILYQIESNLKNEIPKRMLKALNTAFLHQKTFPQYKNINQGKSIVLIASGPSLSFYNPIPEAIHVGVNRAFLFDKVKLDYLFMQDKRAVEKIYDKIRDYKGNDCKKFFGTQGGISTYEIPESIVVQSNGQRYNTSLNITDEHNFVCDISTNPLGNFSSIVFPALQFILYTNPSKIYIVGCDCTGNIHFTKGTDSNFETSNFPREEEDFVIENLPKQWATFKEFAEMYYPDTEIISINPVGLKGLFKDVYQTEDKA